jgi:mannose-1-phosphate guanylyltransferase/mannose-6-phosphate isomerase
MHIVILAGGSGARLWPLSREAFPKQFLTLFGSYSLLQETVLRFLEKYPLLIVTQAPYEPLVKKQLEAIGAGHVPVLAEPARRSTAPAIALALRFLEETQRIEQADPLLVLPSDHCLRPQQIFLDYITQIKSTIHQGKIVTFGISPQSPETGFGYIKMGAPFDSVCRHVDQFVEKPSLEKAEQFLKDPSFYWNSGMLAFSSSSMWEEFALHLPALGQLRTWSWADCLEYFSVLPDISIDYGVIEKTNRAVSCPLALQWSDLGSWEHVYQALEKDQQENVSLGSVVFSNSKRCLVVGGKKIVVAVGLEDVVIVDTDDVLFIARRQESQKIKKLAEHLGVNDFK